MLLTPRLFVVAGVWLALLIVLAILQEWWFRAPRARYPWVFALLAGLAGGPLFLVLFDLSVGTSYPGEGTAGFGIGALFIVSPFWAAVWFVLAILVDAVVKGARRVWSYRALLPIMFSLPLLLLLFAVFAEPHPIQLAVTSEEHLVSWKGTVSTENGRESVESWASQEQRAHNLSIRVGCPGRQMCTTASVTAEIAAYIPGPEQDVPAHRFRVCLTDQLTDKRACDTGAGTVTVILRL